MKKSTKKIIKITSITLAVVIGLPVLVVGSYVVYVVCSYHRIGNQVLDVDRNSNIEKVETDKELTVSTFNVGFGAYSPDYTFFMDEGYNMDGTKTVGTHGKGESKEDVQKNTNGIKSVITDLNSDFYCMQEVDVDSDRSYHINQESEFESAFQFYDKTFGINYDSAYLFYPLNDPIGKSKSGLSTMSKYQINYSERVEYTVSTEFSKFFDLDRCFDVNRIKTDNGKEFVLINSHMSAYDEGGKIRNTQVQELYSYIKNEYDKGNYVIVGGDFNHDLLTNNPMYPQYTSEDFAFKNQVNQLKPDWLNYMFDEDKKSPFDDGFKIYAADNLPSCRDVDITWQEGTTFVSTVDGFIVSDNIEVKNTTITKTGDTGFAYSDHQPSTLTFKLK